MRYAGQNYELAIPIQDGLAAAFAAAHLRLYGFAAANEPIQLVTFRLAAFAVVPKANFAAQQNAGPNASGAIIAHRSLWLPEASGFVDCPVYDRTLLRAGNRFEGPAVVEQMDATTVVLPGMSARVEPFLNLILEAA